MLLPPLLNERGTGGIPQGKACLSCDVKSMEGMVDGFIGGTGISQTCTGLQGSPWGGVWHQPGMCHHPVQCQSQGGIDRQEARDEVLSLLAHVLPLGARQIKLTRSDALHNVMGWHDLGVEGGVATEQGILEAKAKERREQHNFIYLPNCH